VNRAWKVGASVTSAAFAVVVEPFAVVPAGSGTTHRYELLRKLSVSVVGGGSVRSPLPDASKPLGLLRAGLII
jgi:hypothetical protein